MKTWKSKRQPDGTFAVFDANTGQRVCIIDRSWGLGDAEQMAALIASAPELKQQAGEHQ